tara:strand:+ start:456 stop:854 length:399 start_codon:yes stop_codon:yes gene_type:complete
MEKYNIIINLLNLFLILLYFIFININLINKEFGLLLICLIIINLVFKLFDWSNTSQFKIGKINNLIDNIFFNNKFLKIIIFILSILLPIYMIVQKDSLVIDIFIEKISFFLVFLLSLVGFCLEFFILKKRIR